MLAQDIPLLQQELMVVAELVQFCDQYCREDMVN
jgi:hypothetical protein